MSLQATFCATLVDEWARAGVTHAVASPGSRSTPLILAIERDPRISLHMRLDERSAGFAALGIGLATGRPALLVTTSGTAAAEVHAAVVEAHQARVPLIVCTADRPPELQGVGAPQTIDQVGLYQRAVRFSLSIPVPEAGSREAWRSLASRLFAEATSSPSGPGPVHLNVGFREPFDSEVDPLPSGREGGAPWHQVLEPPPSPARDWEALDEVLSSARRPLILAGGGAGDPGALREGAAVAGWPVLADPRSGLRRLEGGDAAVVAAGDALFRVGGLVERLRPDLVLRLGAPPASKVIATVLSELAREGSREVLVDPYGEWRDPGRESAIVLGAPPEEVVGRLGRAPTEPGWAKSWAEAEAAAQTAIDEALAEIGASGELTEPLIARRLAAAGAGTVVAASSMPIRDLEWFSQPSASYPVVYSNRGANGIDGVSSTALGAALGGAAGPVVGLLGDLAFLHDLTALYQPLAGSAERSSPCGLVVVDNKGGGIFSYLPQASSLDGPTFERLFATPQDLDLGELASACGCRVREVRAAGEIEGGLVDFVAELASAQPGRIAAVLLCRTDRSRGVAVHERLNAAVAAALS